MSYIEIYQDELNRLSDIKFRLVEVGEMTVITSKKDDKCFEMRILTDMLKNPLFPPQSIVDSISKEMEN